MTAFPNVPQQVEGPLWKRWLEKLSMSMWTLPEYTADPSSPTPGDTWVRFSGGVYELSFRTKAGTTKRVTLS